MENWYLQHVKDYFHFTGAKHFVKDGRPFQYEKKWQERLGEKIMFPVASFLDITLREIKNPVTVVALTALAALVVTLVFYPHLVVIEPWVIKTSAYVGLQTFIFGWGMRGYGRFANESLCDEWKSGALQPFFIGAKKV
jgi:hypothetical protein